MFETYGDVIVEAFESCSPYVKISIFCLGVRFLSRVILDVVRGDVGCGPISNESDVKEEFDRYIDDEVSEECDEKENESLEECEDDLLKWTCDYCGSVHRNTDCVCSSCGGRRLRW